jgi:hypothetical protein
MWPVFIVEMGFILPCFVYAVCLMLLLWWHYAECHYPLCQYAECRYVLRHCAEWCISNVVMLYVIILNVNMLCVIMLSLW